MAGNTTTKADLSEAVRVEIGLPRKESGRLVEAVLAEMCDALARGEDVKLSSFGSFMLRGKGERTGRNPKTGEEVPIPPRRILVYRPSNKLKDAPEPVRQRLEPGRRAATADREQAMDAADRH